jgi:hypothetical protein
MSTRRSSRLQGLQLENPPVPPQEELPKKSNAKSRKQKSKTPSPKSSPKSSRKHKLPEASAAAAFSAATATATSAVFHYIHNCHDRALITVPVNNTDLWPTPNVPFFRSTGTSNEGHSIFRDTWFPFVSMKNASTMPRYLNTQKDGFLIKSSFLINGSETAFPLRPKWLNDILHEYPIPMDADKLAFLKRNKINVNTFREVYMFITKYTGKEPIYFDIVRLVLDEVETCFVKFLNYFSYPWQVMISWNIGTGYWTLNRNLYEYIGEKLREHNIIRYTLPTVGASSPCTDNTYENITEALHYLKHNKAQMTMAQIKELSDKEQASVGIVKGGLNFGLRDIFSNIVNRLQNIITMAHI